MNIHEERAQRRRWNSMTCANHPDGALACDCGRPDCEECREAQLTCDGCCHRAANRSEILTTLSLKPARRGRLCRACRQKLKDRGRLWRVVG